jgi:hypothetical protein
VPAGKQYKVIRPFRRTDEKTLVDVDYKVGDAYPGPVDKPYYTSPEGPDGKGPLLAEVSVPTPAPASDSTKEK